MSNLGIKEIKVPSNLNLDKQQDTLIIKGDFGQVNYEIDSRFSLDLMENGSLKFYPKKNLVLSERKKIKALWGTQYSLLKNYIQGMSQGYKKTLELVGVGFRVSLIKNDLVLKLGYSHEVHFNIPSDIVIQCPSPDKIVIFGICKQKVNEVVSLIQSLKKIDLYKGKGILLENTKLRLKEGKKK